MDHVVSDQENIQRMKRIHFILDSIADLSRQKNYDFIKLMKMKIPLLTGRIPKMEIVMIFLKIAFLFYIRSVIFRFQTIPLLPRKNVSYFSYHTVPDHRQSV